MSYNSYKEVEENFLEKEKDEYMKWPVRGRFNPVKEAIKNLWEYKQYNFSPEEYYLALDNEISRLVNNAI